MRWGWWVLARAIVVAALVAGAMHITAPAVSGASDPVCLRHPTSIAALIDLAEHPGPLSQRYPPQLAWINEAARACFGPRTLHLRAFVDQTGGVGGTSMYGITPDWFLTTRLFVFESDKETRPGVGDGRFYGLTLAPGLDGDPQVEFARQWVELTGHFMDHRARSCTANGSPGNTPTRAEAIRICQSMFVVTRIRSLGTSLDTSTISPPPTSREFPVAPALLAAVAAAGAAASADRRRNRKRPGR